MNREECKNRKQEAMALGLNRNLPRYNADYATPKPSLANQQINVEREIGLLSTLAAVLTILAVIVVVALLTGALR